MLTSHSLEIPLVSLYPPAPICPHTDHIPAAVLARRHRHLRIGPGLNIRTSRPCPALTADTKTIGPPNGGKFEGWRHVQQPASCQPRVHDWICFLRNLSSSSGEVACDHPTKCNYVFFLIFNKGNLETCQVRKSQKKDLLTSYSK